jgi:hypothetical protein
MIDGSGLKYSIASLLRQGIFFKVFSGETEILITTKKKMFRDKQFDVIYIDGNETSLTTEMGEGVTNDWEEAFPIFREIYSNSIDEGDLGLKVVPTVQGKPGITCFFIEYTSQFKELFENFSDYFSFRTEVIEEVKPEKYNSRDMIKILPKNKDPKVRIFRKGILAKKFDDNKDRVDSLFNYDLNNASINESRVLSNIYHTQKMIGNALFSLSDLSTFKKYVSWLEGGNSGRFEHDCMPASYDYPNMKPEIVQWINSQKWVAVEHLMFFSEPPSSIYIRMPAKWLERAQKQAEDMFILGMSEDGTFSEPAEPSEALIDSMIDAISFLKQTSYASKVDNFKFIYVKFDEPETLAKFNAKSNQIELSINLESKDPYFIAKILMEEIEHGLTGYSDSTREFQNHWIDLLFKEMLKNRRINKLNLKK